MSEDIESNWKLDCRHIEHGGAVNAAQLYTDESHVNHAALT